MIEYPDAVHDPAAVSVIRDQFDELIHGMRTQFWDAEHNLWRKEV